MTTTLIKNAHIVDPSQQLDAVADIALTDSKITAIKEIPEGFDADQIIDAKDKIIFPGLVDLSVHLREPGYEHKATIRSETTAAAKAGITSLCCMPGTSPVIDTSSVADFILRRSEQANQARVFPVAALTKELAGKQLTEMAALKKAGCVAVSNGGEPITDTRILRHCFEYAASFDLTVIIQAEDACLGGSGCMHEGPISLRLGLPGIPAQAETMEIYRCLKLIELTGVKAHFSKISAAQSLDLIATAKAKGLPVTADVAIHNLWLTEMDVSDFDSCYHVRPPLRTTLDRQLLQEAVRDGVIDAICSDHQPHEQDVKLLPFQESQPGISGLETLLPLTLRLVEQGTLTFSQAIEKLAYNPSNILNLPAGKLTVGSQADLCIYDPKATLRITPETIHSCGKNTPFMKWDFNGDVEQVFIAGNLVKNLPEDK